MDVYFHSFHGLTGNHTLPLPRGASPLGRCSPSWARRTAQPSSTCWGGSCWSRAAAAAVAAAAGRAGGSLEEDSRSPAEDSVPVHSYCTPDVFLRVDSEINLKCGAPRSSHMYMFCCSLYTAMPSLPPNQEQSMGSAYIFFFFGFTSGLQTNVKGTCRHLVYHHECVTS